MPRFFSFFRCAIVVCKARGENANQRERTRGVPIGLQDCREGTLEGPDRTQGFDLPLIEANKRFVLIDCDEYIDENGKYLPANA